MQKRLYEAKSGRCGCCLSRWIRKRFMSYRAMRKSAETIHYSSFAADKYFVIQLLHALDLLTDFSLANHLYWVSRPQKNLLGYELRHKNEAHCNIAFVWCVMAIIGPYIIQYSSMMNSYFIKGVFNEAMWNEFTFIRKVYLWGTFTFLGLVLMPIIDCYMKFEAVI